MGKFLENFPCSYPPTLIGGKKGTSQVKFKISTRLLCEHRESRSRTHRNGRTSCRAVCRVFSNCAIFRERILQDYIVAINWPYDRMFTRCTNKKEGIITIIRRHYVSAGNYYATKSINFVIFKRRNWGCWKATSYRWEIMFREHLDITRQVIMWQMGIVKKINVNFASFESNVPETRKCFDFSMSEFEILEIMGNWRFVGRNLFLMYFSIFMKKVSGFTGRKVSPMLLQFTSKMAFVISKYFGKHVSLK